MKMIKNKNLVRMRKGLFVVLALFMFLFTIQGATAVTQDDLLDGLVSYWDGSYSSTTAIDVHGSNNGTASNSRVFDTDGKISKGFDFTKGDDYVNSNLNINNYEDVTISFWFKPDTKINADLMGDWGTNVGTFIIQQSSTAGFRVLFKNKDAGTIETAYSGSYDADTWYHIVVIYKKNDYAYMYVNNVSKVSTGATGNFNIGYLTTQNFHIGKTASRSNYADGIIDELSIWNRALNSSEISALYDIQKDSLTSGSYNFTGLTHTPIISNFSVSVKDVYTNANVNNISVIVDGTTYTNTTGNTITTNILQNDSNTYLVQVSANNYFSRNYTNTNVSSNLVAELGSSRIGFTATELFTNINLTGFFLFDKDKVADSLIENLVFNTLKSSTGSTFQLSRNITGFAQEYVYNLGIEHSSSSVSGTTRCSEVYANFVFLDGSSYKSSTDKVCSTTYSVFDIPMNESVQKELNYIEIWNRNIHNSYAGRVKDVTLEYWDKSVSFSESDNLFTTGNFTFLFLNNNYYLKEFSDEIFALDVKNISVGNLTDSVLNVNVRTKVGNLSVDYFEGWLYQGDYDYNLSFGGDNGSISFDLKTGLNYTLYIDGEGFAITDDNLVSFYLNDSSLDLFFYLYKENSLDISFRDFDTKNLITENITFEMISDVQSYNYSTTSGTLNLTFIVPSDYIFRYQSSNYSEHFYLIDVEDKSYDSLTLYLINKTKADVITINIIDESAKVVEGAVVKSLKYDLLTNSYLVQEIKRTNFAGETTFNVVKNEEFYRFVVEIDGVMVRMTNPSYITSDILNIQIIRVGLIAGEFFDLYGITSSVTYNNNTGNFRAEYNDPSNVGTRYCLVVYSMGLAKTEIGEECSTSSSGVLLVPISVENGSIYEAQFYLNINPDLVLNTFNLDLTSIFDAGNMGLLIQILITIFFALTFIYNPTIGVIVTPMSLVIGRLIGLHSVSWIYLTPLIIVGVIIAFILRR